MKKNTLIIMFLVTFGIIFGSAGTALAQENAREAADFAVETQNQIDGLKRSLQSVNNYKVKKETKLGIRETTYELCLEVSAEGKDGTHFVKAEVNISFEPTLVSWKKSDCRQ